MGGAITAVGKDLGVTQSEECEAEKMDTLFCVNSNPANPGECLQPTGGGGRYIKNGTQARARGREVLEKWAYRNRELWVRAKCSLNTVQWQAFEMAVLALELDENPALRRRNIGQALVTDVIEGLKNVDYRGVETSLYHFIIFFFTLKTVTSVGVHYVKRRVSQKNKTTRRNTRSKRNKSRTRR